MVVLRMPVPVQLRQQPVDPRPALALVPGPEAVLAPGCQFVFERARVQPGRAQPAVAVREYRLASALERVPGRAEERAVVAPECRPGSVPVWTLPVRPAEWAGANIQSVREAPALRRLESPVERPVRDHKLAAEQPSAQK